MTDGKLCSAKPDLYYGARPEQLDLQVREKLRPYIIPSTQEDLPMAPNFFLEVRGPHGTYAVAPRPSCYAGALGARAMHKLQSYGEPEAGCSNDAYTITSIYEGGSGFLKLYTTHPTRSENPRCSTEYNLTQIIAFAMTGTLDSFRDGITAFRNARDLMKEVRDGFISAANEKARAVTEADPP